MNAIRLRQIYESVGYNKHRNTMVFNMERKRVAQKIREMPRDDYAMIDAQRMMDVSDAANSLQLMLDGKLGNLSVMAHHGMSVDNTQFGYDAKIRLGGGGRGGQVQRDLRALHGCQRRDGAATTQTS